MKIINIIKRNIRVRRKLKQSGYKDFLSAMQSLDFYKQRVLELERNKDVFPEPYYTKLCNILANGRMEL